MAVSRSCLAMVRLVTIEICRSKPDDLDLGALAQVHSENEVVGFPAIEAGHFAHGGVVDPDFVVLHDCPLALIISSAML